MFTTLSKKEISKLSKLKDKEINDAKQVLAFEVTKMVRGEEGANEANEMANNLFKSNITDIRVNNFTLNSKKILDNSFTIIDAIEKLNLVKSRSEIKRLIKSNGIRVNDKVYSDENYSLKNYQDKEIKITIGKKRVGVLILTNDN